MAKLRQWLATRAGRTLAITASLLLAVVTALLMHSHLGTGDAAALSRRRTFVCAQTLKPFEYEMREGTTIPVPSPYSGQATGYPAELCYWTAEGKARDDDPTPVLLNTYRKVPEPTFCPECGRLVVGLNPPPEADRQPPPTREQWLARAGQTRRQ